jgi:hypothetical protein
MVIASPGESTGGANVQGFNVPITRYDLTTEAAVGRLIDQLPQIAMFLATVAAVLEPLPGDEVVAGAAATRVAVGRGTTGTVARAATVSPADEAIVARIACTAKLPVSVNVVKAGPVGLADDLLRYSGNITPKTGFTDVFIHADAQAFHVLHNGKWAQLTHRDIAGFLSSKNITGNLRLISCNAAESQLAQNLANKLGVTVEAATSKVLVPKNFTSAPLLEPGGQWKIVTPGGK